MIKIDKSTTVPKSLQSAINNKRRTELIKAGFYPTPKTIQNTNFSSKDVKTYDSRYKTEDVKIALNHLYHGKCAYCETQVEQYHIEHYRAKSIYYWLAYSWDNLLLCCPTCNEHKSANFIVDNQADINSISIINIHNLRDAYDTFEQPQLINPEKEELTNDLIFDELGNISSNNSRVQTTIEVCQLHRDWLNNRRRELYNDFEKKVTNRIYELKNGDKSAAAKLIGLIEDFMSDSENPIKEYMAFRKYIVKNLLNKLMSYEQNNRNLL